MASANPCTHACKLERKKEVEGMEFVCVWMMRQWTCLVEHGDDLGLLALVLEPVGGGQLRGLLGRGRRRLRGAGAGGAALVARVRVGGRGPTPAPWAALDLPTPDAAELLEELLRRVGVLGVAQHARDVGRAVADMQLLPQRADLAVQCHRQLLLLHRRVTLMLLLSVEVEHAAPDP